MKYETTWEDIQKAITNHTPLTSAFKESVKSSLNKQYGINTSIKICIALNDLKHERFTTSLKASLFDDLFNKVTHIIDTSTHSALLYLSRVIQTSSLAAEMFEELDLLNLTNTTEIIHEIAYAMSETIVRTLEEDK